MGQRQGLLHHLRTKENPRPGDNYNFSGDFGLLTIGQIDCVCEGVLDLPIYLQLVGDRIAIDCVINGNLCV